MIVNKASQHTSAGFLYDSLWYIYVALYVLATLTRMWLLVLFQNLPKSPKISLVAGHLGEGLLELLVDRLELLLLGDQLVLQSVHLHQKRRVTRILQWNKRRVDGWSKRINPIIKLSPLLEAS